MTHLRLPWIPLTVLLVMVICALFAPILAPYGPTSINMLDSRLAPLKDTSHILGTDVLGRDMLSRLIYGARTSMLISLVALATGALVGTLLGLISGYKGGWLDALIMRTVDAALGFPTILVAMIIVVLWGTGVASVMLAVLIIGVMKRWTIDISATPQYCLIRREPSNPVYWMGGCARFPLIDCPQFESAPGGKSMKKKSRLSSSAREWIYHFSTRSSSRCEPPYLRRRSRNCSTRGTVSRKLSG